MLEAVKVTLDPTPRQERLLESHAGAARFAYKRTGARQGRARTRRCPRMVVLCLA
ncbi:helix-turn-helix domain-containing protein [Bifidobacterium longum]|uniref:helix-turn-helix domain-containing protein n=1 Tax=Bifidobacterium longum TaxID=216816 RepID=UPI001D01BE51|nr:helix-turn-helix domain-containing protein [Bifidobacterium longum]